MSASIRLKRFGSKKRPYYRIVVMDIKAPRDGRTLEELGYYHPIEAEDKQISFDADKVRSWLDKGAKVSDTVRGILNKKNFKLNFWNSYLRFRGKTEPLVGFSKASSKTNRVLELALPVKVSFHYLKRSTCP